jgi:hypothetical protein
VCVFHGAPSASVHSTWARHGSRGGQYHFPPSQNVSPVPLQGSSPRASRQSRVEFRPMAFREAMVTCRHGRPLCVWGWCDQCDLRSREETHSDRRFGYSVGNETDRPGLVAQRNLGSRTSTYGGSPCGAAPAPAVTVSRLPVWAPPVSPPGGRAWLDVGVRAGPVGFLWSSLLLVSYWWTAGVAVQNLSDWDRSRPGTTGSAASPRSPSCLSTSSSSPGATSPES